MKFLNKKNLLLLVILLALAAGYGFWKFKNSSSVKYKEYVVTKSDFEIFSLSNGSVLPENRLEIKAPVAGRIESVLTSEGKRVKKGQILAWMSSTERAAMLDAARARGDEELKKWEELYKPTPILAPLPGMIILRNIEPGQTITANDAIFAMSDRLTVKAQVDETDIAKIKLHQDAEIILDAYPDKPLRATVDQIAFEAKTVSNVTTYVVDVLPANSPDFLRSGMTANVRFRQQKKEQVLLLATEAIQNENGKIFVLKKTDAKQPMQQEIQTGISDGKRTEVISGLNENDIVLRAEQNTSDKNSSSNPFSPFGAKRPGQGGGSGNRR